MLRNVKYSIMKVGHIIQLQRPVYYLLLCGVGVVIVLTIFGQQVILNQLHTWQLLPRPEKLTELYFTNHAHLPVKYPIGSEQKISFTIRNLEHQTTDYKYELVAKAADKEQVLGGGVARLNHDTMQNISQMFVVPPLDSRMEIQVRLKNAGQIQKIHYWVNTVKGV